MNFSLRTLIVAQTCALTIALVAAAAVPALTPAPSAVPPRVDVLVTEQTPEGTVVRTGYLGDYQYTGSIMALTFVDDGDALFHNGFEGTP